MKSSTIETCFTELANTALNDCGTPLTLATVIQVVSPTSAKPGDKALVSQNQIVDGWIGGGCAQPSVIEAARRVLESGEPCIIRVGPKGEWQSLEGMIDFTSGCLSGGTLLIFIEPLIRQPKLCILGHSPVAISLCVQAATLGFSVQVASPDIDPTLFPDTIACTSDFTQISGDYLVIATQGKHDRKALHAALESDADYISMVASEKKITGLKASLAKSGVQADLLDNIQGPAGIDIGAQTPAEIALSILADVVRVRRSGRLANARPAVGKKYSELTETTDNGSCCSG